MFRELYDVVAKGAEHVLSWDSIDPEDPVDGKPMTGGQESTLGLTYRTSNGVAIDKVA